MVASANFGFLAKHAPVLDLLGGQAERYFADDPNTSLIKIRQYGEALAQLTAAHVGVATENRDFKGLLDDLWSAGLLQGTEAARVFHDLRRAGNRAVHEHTGDHAEALHQLKMARKLAIWFHRSVAGNAAFKAGPFVPPQAPARAPEPRVTAELENLRRDLERSRKAAEEARQQAEEEARLRAEAETRAHAKGEDLEAALALAQEMEERLVEAQQEHQRALVHVSADTDAIPAQLVREVIGKANADGADLDLSEAETRRLIDQQLRDAGWEADTDTLRWSAGARPQKGKNLAIAEVPTATGPADYVLYAGLTVIGVVEAKKKNKNVEGAIEQAKRYSRSYAVLAEEELAGGPWGNLRVPFLFSTNGRPFHRQIKEKSGTWFRDARQSTNHPRALEGWYRPEELVALLKQDADEATQKLEAESPAYLPLREYQFEAVRAVEAAILDGKREMLVAMATGTGKTRTAIGLIYRLVKAGVFRRVLFLVDRTALGEQAANAFKDVRLESHLTFTQVFDVKELGDIRPDKDTRLQFATVQGMVKRLMFSEPEDMPSVGAYDAIVVDESHRGYNLDREMSDAELEFRSQDDYISKYRRVLDHFDAVKIGLTATPAKHTVDIFGAPVYTYSYRQAVLDGFLVDHEPPIRIVTQLARDGITWNAGEEVAVFDTRRQQLDLFQAPDEINIEVDGFNRRVLTENFNRAVCGRLAKHIDPTQPGKTLVYCVTDEHADLVVRVLKEVFDAKYGGIDDDLVQKITGAADRPLERIRRYKNERAPNVAVTVDLLTTGIDVPAITNLVFLRRVRSRILFDQMLGRATRLCPDIGKERFRIFDAVDLYAALLDQTDMKPVVVSPNISFATLVKEITEVKDEEARQEFLEQLVAKLQRKKRAIRGQRAQDFATLAETDVNGLLDLLRHATPTAAAAWFAAHPEVAAFLDKVVGEGSKVLVSNHDDEVVEESRGYGTAKRPEDYLESFRRYLQENLDRLPALILVTQRPRDLTRKGLRELRIQLDQAGFSETSLRTAVRETTNADIAASIIGFVRSQLLDAPLVPFEERVDRAMHAILARQAWSEPQRRWLERIAKQVKKEGVVDHDALEAGQFKTHGGFRRIDSVYFDGQLDALLKDIQATIWSDAAA